MIEMHLQEALFYLNALSKQACVVLSANLHVVVTPLMDNAINICYKQVTRAAGSSFLEPPMTVIL